MLAKSNRLRSFVRELTLDTHYCALRMSRASWPGLFIRFDTLVSILDLLPQLDALSLGNCCLLPRTLSRSLRYSAVHRLRSLEITHREETLQPVLDVLTSFGHVCVLMVHWDPPPVTMTGLPTQGPFCVGDVGFVHLLLPVDSVGLFGSGWQDERTIIEFITTMLDPQSLRSVTFERTFTPALVELLLSMTNIRHLAYMADDTYTPVPLARHLQLSSLTIAASAEIPGDNNGSGPFWSGSLRDLEHFASTHTTHIMLHMILQSDLWWMTREDVEVDLTHCLTAGFDWTYFADAVAQYSSLETLQIWVSCQMGSVLSLPQTPVLNVFRQLCQQMLPTSIQSKLSFVIEQ